MDNRKIMLWIIAFILISANAAALGLTPARTTIDFTPNSKHTVSFTVVNDEHRDMKLIVYPVGELSGMVSIKEQIVELSASEGSKTLTYDVMLPEEMEPGRKTANIVIQDTTSTNEFSPTKVAAAVGIMGELVVKVPYPGKYLQTEGIEVSQGKTNKDIGFKMPVTNMGMDKLTKIEGLIEIRGPTNEVLEQIETNEIGLEPKQRNILKAYWNAENANPGKYFAVATIKYAHKSVKLEKAFEVGELDIEVLKVETKNFQLGGIAKIDILLRSHWNNIIENLYGTLTIKDKQGDPVSDIKTASVDILPNSVEEINAYWETEGLKMGDYDMKLKLHFNGRTIEKDLVTEIGQDYMKISMLSATGQVIRKESKIDRTQMLSVLIVILIIVNIGWFVYFRKRKK